MFLLAGILALTACVYGKTLGYHFVGWDDNIHIYGNALLKNLSWGAVRKFWSAPFEELYIPISYSAYDALAFLSHLIFPAFMDGETSSSLNPLVFHAANLALHLANVSLVFLILFRCAKNDLAAAAGALVFAIHPLQTESVAWCSELRGLLSGLFCLISILIYARSFGDSRQNFRFSAARVLLVGFFMLLALLSKPSAVALPLVLFGLGYAYSGVALKRTAAETLPLAVLALPILFVTRASQHLELSQAAPLFLRGFTAGDALSFYLVKLAIPIRLCIDYGRTPTAVLSHWWAYADWIFPAALFALAFVFRRRSKTPLAALAVFFGFLLPVLGFFPFIYQNYSTVADRYVYLAMLGPALLIARLLARMNRPFYYLAAFEVALALGLFSFVQAGVWKNSDALWNGCLAENPLSVGCNNNKGLDLAQKGLIRDAEPYFEKSLQNKGAGSDLIKVAMSNLGLIYYSLGEYEKSESCFYKLILISPYDAKAHYNRSKALVKLKQFDEAADEVEIALRLHPGRAQAATLFECLGDDFLLGGKYDDAFAVYGQAARMNPESGEVSRKAAGAAIKCRRYDQALEICEMLLRKYPKDVRVKDMIETASRFSKLRR